MTLLTVTVPATGLLPLGRARLAHAAWRRARDLGGRFVLIVDDTIVNKPGAPPDDLAWLGLDWDSLERRSDNTARHAAAAARLEQATRLYPCFENADELRAKADRQRRRGQLVRYDRAMLKLTADQRAAAEAGGKRPHWRFQLSNMVVAWRDDRLGRTEFALPSLSDPVLRAPDGTIDPALAGVADDLALGVTHRVSGEEHIATTAVHLDLMDALGGDPTALHLAHLPVLSEATGRRLQGQTLRSLRQDGIVPAALRAWFDALQQPGAGRIEIEDLLAHNRAALATLPFADAAALLPPEADAAFWLSVRGEIDLITEARALLPRVGKR